MHELPWITIFGSRVRWFANDFHTWRSHEWKSLANRITSDPKITIHVTNVLFYFLHAILCLEHKIPQKTLSIADFIIVAKDSLFLALWCHHSSSAMSHECKMIFLYWDGPQMAPIHYLKKCLLNFMQFIKSIMGFRTSIILHNPLRSHKIS